MNTANTTPSPATVTIPPLWLRSDGAPAVEAFTGADDDVADVELDFLVADAIPVADAAPLAAPDDLVELEVLPVAAEAADDVLDFLELVESMELDEDYGLLSKIKGVEDKSLTLDCAETAQAARATRRKLEYCIVMFSWGFGLNFYKWSVGEDGLGSISVGLLIIVFIVMN